MSIFDWIADVGREAADREASNDAAREHQSEAGEPDSKENFEAAEWDAMADAADEGQTFTNN